jgi:hypothetical protein
MTKGLVRANNFSDLADKDEAVVNLGLSAADYAALKGLYTTAGIDFAVIGEIGNSQGNYQAQLDGIGTTLSGVVLSGYVNRSGDTILGTWTHSGIINISSGLPSGYPASTDSLFSLSIESGEAVIVASGLIASGLSYNGVRQSSSTVQRAFPPSGFSPLHLIPLQVGGQSFFAEAGESPSFHIAPARTGHALDLVTGNLLGTYNSASPALAVGPDGVLFQPAANAPVIEYDPTTLACLGARIWGVVTNLLLRSEELENAAWSRAALTVSSDVTTSPKGIQDADKLVESATNAEHITWQSRSAQSETMTLSVFAKASERSRIKLGFSNFATAACGALFNLSTGVVISTDAANADYTSPAASIIAYPAGWYRCVFTVTKGTVNNTNNPFVDIVNNSNQFIYAGDGTSGVFAWGAQVNTGPLAPYVPTTTTAASSTADVWTITGADFSRIFNPTELTIYAEATSQSSADSTIWQIDDNSGNANRFTQYFASNILRSRTTISNSQNDIDRTGVAVGVPARGAYGIKASDYAAVLNGGTIGTSAHALPSATMSILRIGSVHPGGAVMLNGYIRELAIFRSRRPNTNLQAMTS